MKILQEIPDKTKLKNIGIGFLIFAIVFSIGWSIEDQKLNLWPFVLAGAWYGVIWLAAYLLRDNP